MKKYYLEGNQQNCNSDQTKKKLRKPQINQATKHKATNY